MIKLKIDNKEHELDSPVRLHLGCGSSYFSEYVNLDYPQDKHSVSKVAPDITGDITTLELPNNSVEEIRNHHFFEHFGRIDSLVLLIKWHMWLEVESLLHIEVPDLEGSCIALCNQNNFGVQMAQIRHLVGDQTDFWGYHKELWTQNRLTTTLSLLGFEIINTERSRWNRPPYLANLTVKAIKKNHKSKEELFGISKKILRFFLVGEKEVTNKLPIWCNQLASKLNIKGEN